MGSFSESELYRRAHRAFYLLIICYYSLILITLINIISTRREEEFRGV